MRYASVLSSTSHVHAELQGVEAAVVNTGVLKEYAQVGAVYARVLHAHHNAAAAHAT